jgi:hypothetical protein
MNLGARACTGGRLLFLHADARLPSGYAECLDEVLGDPRVALGAFPLALDAPGPGLRAVERLANWRARCCGLPYGDQALALRRETFAALAGYREWPLLEDLELVRRARRLGQVRLARRPVRVSARRWQRHGLLRTTLLNQLILAGYACGVSPARLARWYRGR